MEGEPRDLVVITGASRGIGKATALALARYCDILGIFVDPRKEARAEETVAEIEGLGGRASFVLSDITTPLGRKVLIGQAAMAARDGQRVHLILNAAGGLEEGKRDYWARRINTEAQLSLAREFSKHIMSEGSVLVYPTSIFAHGFLPDELNGGRQFVQPPSYYLVAETKFDTERKLQEMAPTFAKRGQRLGFTIGQLIEGTAAYTLYKRYYPERLAAMASLCEGGVLHEAPDMGEAARFLILTGDLPNAHRIFVGGDQAELIDPTLAGDYTLDRAAIKKKLPMYGDIKLYADVFRSKKGSKRFGELDFTARDVDVEGHFEGDFADIKLYRGVDQTEMAGQSVGLTLLSMEPQAGFVPVYQEAHSRWLSTVLPGETIIAKAEVTSFTGRSARGKADLYVGDRKVSEHDNLVFGLIPDIDTARRLLQKQRAG